MKALSKLWRVAIPLIALVFMPSCGKDDEPNNPGSTDNGEVVTPDTPVNDPDGTIRLTMNFGTSNTRIGTYLYMSASGNLTIDDKDINNYHSQIDYPEYKSGIVSIGKCSGLGNVSSIPRTGWASSVQAIKGNGYIYYDGYEGKYYRIFIDSENKTTNVNEGLTGPYETSETIGFNVKYQYPFKGADVELTPEETSITLDNTMSGQTAIFLTNISVVPFDVTYSEAGWFGVRKCTDLAMPFLYNGIVVYVYDANQNPEPRSSTITLTNGYGKSVDIELTQAGEAPYLYVDSSLEDETNYYKNLFTSEGGSNRIEFSTNIPYNMIDVNCDVDWCVAHVSSDYYGAQSNHNVTFIEGASPLDEPISSRSDSRTIQSCYLILNANQNIGEYREGYVTLSYEDMVCRVKVAQEGKNYYLLDQTIEMTASQETFSFELNTNIAPENLILTPEDYWIKVTDVTKLGYGTNSSVIVKGEVEPNNTNSPRTGTISVASDVTSKTATLTIYQSGQTLTLSEYECWYDRNGGNTTITVYSSLSPSDIEVKSSADWLTYSFNGNQMTIRVAATTEDREAELTFGGFDAKLVVNQSAFAVGDEYDVDGILGTVYYMKNDLRLVKRDLEQSAEWSTENVIIGANDHYDGRNNWKVVTSIPGWQELYPAFALVENTLNVDGITGWYIPADYEANNYSSNYWSSTERDKDNAYRLGYYYGYYTASKSTSLYVVAVHRF